MRQTLAILLDAYRELNARKIFWIVLGLSGLVVTVFAMLSINERGIAFAFWTIDSSILNTNTMTKEFFYKTYFITFGVGIWLTWIATILALVSTAPIIPDFVSSGAIELSLAKPIGRLRLFLTKYLAGLLFVVLQVSIFSLGGFFVLGVRSGSWIPSIFLAIPIVTIFFSYLFTVCTFIGLITRSTITSLLITLLFWSLLFLLQSGETSLLTFKSMGTAQAHVTEQRIELLDSRLEISRKKLKQAQANFVTDPSEKNQFEIDRYESRITGGEDLRETFVSKLMAGKQMETSLGKWQRRIHTANTILPKTGETKDLLNRWLIPLDEIPNFGNTADAPADQTIESLTEHSGDWENDEQIQTFANRLAQEEIRSRSIFWIVGTSLIFEFVLLGAASWIFVRRDF